MMSAQLSAGPQGGQGGQGRSRRRSAARALVGLGAWLGRIYPTAHFLTIARGTFAKGLGFADLANAFLPLLLAGPALLLLCAALLRKQAR